MPKAKTDNSSAATARRRTAAAKKTASAPAAAGGAARSAKRPAAERGRLKPHPVVDQFAAAAAAMARHFYGDDWESASLVIPRSESGAGRYRPPFVLSVENPAHAPDHAPTG